MNALILGCGWVGTHLAARLVGNGYRVWATCTSPEKARRLAQMDGVSAYVADFDGVGQYATLGREMFDLLVVSVPVRRKDSIDAIRHRFAGLQHFLRRISFRQSFFFGSVGIYPKIDGILAENTLGDEDLEPRLLLGETMLRAEHPGLNVLRLGGLFGYDRIMAKYFVDKVCQIGQQPANSIHVMDVIGVILTMVERGMHGKTYNVVCPEHPLKQAVIEVSAAKHGYGLPIAFAEGDRTAKVVSPARLQNELDYRFRYPSPLQF